jgi:hypothetical protein
MTSRSLYFLATLIVASTANMIAETVRELHEEAADQVSPSNLRENLR